MITLLVDNCNQISQSSYNDIINRIQFHRLVCSCNRSACLSIHGYYYRSLKTPSGPVRLRICRVRCSECGRTHALLPSFLVPYSQISTKEQQVICRLYEAGEIPYAICESNSSIDENNVKSVLRSYRSRWKQMLLSLRIGLEPLRELILQCFSNYSVQFMQIHRGVNRLFAVTT